MQLVWSGLSVQLVGTPWHDAQLAEHDVVMHDSKLAYSPCAAVVAALSHAATPPSMNGARAMQSTRVEQLGSFAQVDAAEQQEV
jgi:hypothetical protein